MACAETAIPAAARRKDAMNERRKMTPQEREAEYNRLVDPAFIASIRSGATQFLKWEQSDQPVLIGRHRETGEILALVCGDVVARPLRLRRAVEPIRDADLQALIDMVRYLSPLEEPGLYD